VAPFLHGLGGGLGKAEVDGPGEELLGAIHAAGVQQLLRANQAQGGALLRTDDVLAALPAGGGQVGRAHVAARAKYASTLVRSSSGGPRS